MAIEFLCTCGHVLRARDDLAGRQARCNHCGQVVTVPVPVAAEEIVLDETYEPIAPPSALPLPAPSPAPFVPTGPRPQPKRGLWDRFRRMFSGYREEIFKWQEPFIFRARVKGDVPVRLAVAFGCWGIVTALMLVFFGVNVDPPSILAAILVGAAFGFGFAWMMLFVGRNTAGGLVRVHHEDIYRTRFYMTFDFGRWSAWETWPYEAIHRCMIVPGEALGKSFSVMLLCSATEIDLVGVPKRIDLGHLAEHLTAHGVPVVRGETIPPRFTKRLPIEAGVICGVVGAVCFLGGLVFYVQHAWNRVPIVAEEEVEEDGRDGLPAPEIGDNRRLRPPMDWFPDAPRAPMTPPGFVPPSDPDFVAGRTELVGGVGGGPFELVSAEKEPVLGFRYSMGSWNGQAAIGNLEPLFVRSASSDWEKIVMAREGYAVGGLRVNAEGYVLGIQVVFLAIKPDGSLDATDSYTSEWIGLSATSPTLIGGTGVKIIGVYGRKAAVMDAVGLLTEIR